MRIVQVLMQDQEAKDLASCAKALKISRADLIRRACRAYVDSIRNARLDRQYEKGYRDCPEEPSVAHASATVAASLLPAEDWSV